MSKLVQFLTTNGVIFEIDLRHLLKTSIVIGILCFLIISEGCKKDSILTNAVDLELRIDTLFFDTVFTQFNQGIPLSVNKQFVVINPHKQAVKTDIMLGSGGSSQYRLNVDGVSGSSHENITIESEDSVFVFVEFYAEANADPTARPLISRDSVVINTNGREQDVKLIGWGRDAHYFKDSVLSCNTVWSDKEKPYVVHGYIGVEEGCTFTIEEGVNVHLAPNSWIFVEGSLIMKGSVEEKVRLQGDRLQPDYEEKPGQWGGIQLLNPSNNNVIDHAIIKNGVVGVFCDSLIGASTGPYCTVSNTHIRNMSFDGISGKNSKIAAVNTVIDNCGRYTFFGFWGGEYDLVHCTFAMYPFDFQRNDPTFVLNNQRRDENDQVVEIYPIRMNMINSIVDGSEDEEIGTDLAQDQSSLTFQNSLLKTEIAGLDDVVFNNVLNEEPLFVDKVKHVFALDSLSPAKDIGAELTPSIDTDISGVSRVTPPDAGAYESLF